MGLIEVGQQSQEVIPGHRDDCQPCLAYPPLGTAMSAERPIVSLNFWGNTRLARKTFGKQAHGVARHERLKVFLRERHPIPQICARRTLFLDLSGLQNGDLGRIEPEPAENLPVFARLGAHQELRWFRQDTAERWEVSR